MGIGSIQPDMVLYDERGNFLVGGQLPLATRKGRQIPNDRRMERNPAAMQAARNLWLGRHTAATMRSLTAVYNCMGMVFAARRTWVEPEVLPMVLDDDEYHRLSAPNQVVVGDVVVYRDAQGDVVHVGLVTGVNLGPATRQIMVLSQWGADGEYFHRVDDVPSLLGTPAEYWSDRK